MSAQKASKTHNTYAFMLIFIFPPLPAFTTMQKEEDVPFTSPVMSLKIRKTLKGHRGRILHFDWSPDKYHLVTAGQVCVCV